MPRCSVLAAVLGLAEGCVMRDGAIEEGPCRIVTDCPTAAVCLAGGCVDAWGGLEYRLAGVAVQDCSGEYAYRAVFDGGLVGAASQWQECPAFWSASASTEPFVPTDAEEELQITFMRRYDDHHAATVTFDGIPRDVLHHGQWHGRADDHSISLFFERVD